jgi:glutamine amidotransferase
LIVTIINYGLSNLLSISRAVRNLGHEPLITNLSGDVSVADIIILPGVGAFKDGMDGLSRLGLVAPLREKARAGVPILAICLGMQMLFDESDEFGVHEGLGLIPGRVERIPDLDVRGGRQRVPHVSWNGLYPVTGASFHSALMRGVRPGDEVYFIHSFEVKPLRDEHASAIAYYGGRRVCAAAESGNVFGTQFHPEKSGAVGLGILANFLSSVRRDAVVSSPADQDMHG